MESQRTLDTSGLALCQNNKTEIQKSRKFHPDPLSIGCMSSFGVHTAHVHPGPQSQTHWEALTGEAIVGAGAGTSGIAVVPLPSMLLSSHRPSCHGTLQDRAGGLAVGPPEVPALHLQLLLLGKWRLWHAPPHTCPLVTLTLESLYQGWLFPSQKPCWNQSCPALSVSPALAPKAAAFKESVRAYPGQTVYVTSSIFPVSRTPRPCDPDCRNDVPFPLKPTCLAGQGLRAAL